jgi:hypothetical protein
MAVTTKISVSWDMTPLVWYVGTNAWDEPAVTARVEFEA